MEKMARTGPVRDAERMCGLYVRPYHVTRSPSWLAYVVLAILPWLFLKICFTRNNVSFYQVLHFIVTSHKFLYGPQMYTT